MNKKTFKITLFVLAMTTPKITIEKYTFDSSNDDIMDALLVYFDEEGIIPGEDDFTKDEFEMVCKRMLWEEDLQTFIEDVILTEKELKQIQKFKIK